VALAILVYIEVAWSTRNDNGLLSLEATKAGVSQAVRTNAAERAVLFSIFH
jgi:hypothetical protein